MGGQVPLGYRVRGRKLVIDKEEAATVRLMFERYLALGSLPALQQELRQAGIVSRRRRLSSGAVVGGVPFGNGALAHILRNRVYRGEINHKDRSHPGEHDGRALAAKTRRSAARPSVLKMLANRGGTAAMSPQHEGSGRKRSLRTSSHDSRCYRRTSGRALSWSLFMLTMAWSG
jgi:hypothetical protein